MITPNRPQNPIHCIRLTPSQDLKMELVQFCKQNKIKAGCILSAVGSLQKVNLRLANTIESFISEQNFEVVSATGTISENGCHVHIAIADNQGQVIGGHLLDGNLIYTTCELILQEISNFEFRRELDPQTTFNELKIHFINS